MKVVMKIIKIGLTVFILFILPAVVFTFITSRWPIVMGMRSFTVLSGSMEPTLPVGSIIYTQKQNWYPIGAIIAFKSGDVTVTHRVVDIINKDNLLYFQTKGDANNTKDTHLVPATDVIGQEFFFAPYVGRIMNFTKTPVGFFSIFLFPIVVFLVFELWNLKKEIEKEVEKKIMHKLHNNSVNI